MTPLILTLFCMVPTPYAEIRVVDDAGRGVPLVALETVNHQVFVTDNAGRVAFHEPGLMDREVFFHVRSHGYEIKKDGFGFAGATVVPTAGKSVEIRVKHAMIAERVGRLTGEGLWRDSELLGYTVPERKGTVAGQDSVQAVPYKGNIFWLWGDTNRMKYPLGMYRTAGATTPPFPTKYDFTKGIDYKYHVDDKKTVRAMMPDKDHPEGVIWLDGLCNVRDEDDREKLVAHYSRRRGLGQQLEHGISVYDDDKAIFESVKVLAENNWRHPHGHVVVPNLYDRKSYYFGNPIPNVHVPATLAAILDPEQYTAFVFVRDEGPTKSGTWKWQKVLSPITAKTEQQEFKAAAIPASETRFLPVDANDDGQRITLHNGTVNWNNYRKCYVMLAGQIGGGSSHLGEVWYAEALEPTGPFTKAIKVATHNKQTFYNVCHHAFMDQDDGRTIYFEGTYTEEFSGSGHFTPRYDYNQVLYKLVLSAPDLLPARVR